MTILELDPYDHRRPCHICQESAGRHKISGKLVNVEQWHRVWTALDARPSLADTPITGPSEAAHRPLIAGPIEPTTPPEGLFPPVLRPRIVPGRL